MSFCLQYGKNGIWYGTFPIFPQELVQHGISTRFGGCSKAPFSTMNLAMHNGDALADVIENRERFCEALQLEAARVCTCDQVHGDRIVRVQEPQAGAGSRAYESAIGETDALITDVKNLPLMLFFADCTPIVFVDPVQKAIGIAHGGWKGTVSKIAQKTVRAMQREFGTEPADCLVGIGPAIGPCCYEVDKAVKDKFSAAFTEDSSEIIIPAGGGKWKLDLWAANRRQLEEIGVLPSHIAMANVCTKCNSQVFFSYRADNGQTGRIAALIALK